MSYQLVWFKRDLRWRDHAALAHASRRGPVRCIYVVEPTLWLQPDAALQHFEFVRESLAELHAHLQSLGGGIEIHIGEMPEILEKIWDEAPFAGVYAHQETGNGFTYARDLKVGAWCKAHGVDWQEFAQFGVVRGLKNRNLWQAAWEKHMASPVHQVAHLQFHPSSTAAHLDMPAPLHLQHNPPLRH